MSRPNTDVFFEAGQDWTIFGSSALMNLFETTFFGAYWGNVYERAPQFRFGFVQKLGGSRNWKLSPEFAIMMPSEGNLPADAVTTCTSRQDITAPTTCTRHQRNLATSWDMASARALTTQAPELESRVVLQFQLDKAPGVVPAQILWSGFYTIARQRCWPPPYRSARLPRNFYKTAFPRGVDNNSNGYGNQIAISLPTRWATVVASGYMRS